MMPSNGTIDTSSPTLEREIVQIHKGEEEPSGNCGKEEAQGNGATVKKVGRPGRKRKTPQVQNNETSKDIASVPKCQPSQNISSLEPMHNGDLEKDSIQRKAERHIQEDKEEEDEDDCAQLSLKRRQSFEDETDSLQESETGLSMENGCCTPKDGHDSLDVDEGDLVPATSQKKRGRRRLSIMTEKSKEEKEDSDCQSLKLEGCRGRLRGGLGWETSLRQRPLQRLTFQAGDPYYVSKRKRDEWLARWKREDFDFCKLTQLSPFYVQCSGMKDSINEAEKKQKLVAVMNAVEETTAGDPQKGGGNEPPCLTATHRPSIAHCSYHP
ncbi:DNA (cytosine-5)-methyltransferase 3A-like [Rhinatrema bivittatum]|uniref:DNA (cytosine-5)-methyltransferase 3A-like n=1 Tax=Rhinatrema bivittatum TaxID=194408 RepID=UPI001128404A|nr:DNA (cytosine-5)-methyltransferase 3A-like [Rhinatrema bivittatum]